MVPSTETKAARLGIQVTERTSCPRLTVRSHTPVCNDMDQTMALIERRKTHFSIPHLDSPRGLCEEEFALGTPGDLGHVPQIQTYQVIAGPTHLTHETLWMRKLTMNLKRLANLQPRRRQPASSRNTVKLHTFHIIAVSSHEHVARY